MRSPGALVVGGDYRGLGIVRSLGRHGVPVWVLQGEDVLAGFSRYAQRRVRWHEAGEEEQTDFLVRLADEHGLDGWVLFPTSDETARVVSRSHAVLETRYRLTISPWLRYRVAADKHLAYERAEALGIACPRTSYPTDVRDLDVIDLEFPLIVKPAQRVSRNRLTDAKAWRVEDRAELRARYVEACELVDPCDVMLQEVIPGGGEAQLSFAAVCREGEPLAYLTARRARQYPTDFGRASTFVETVDRPEIIEPSRRLLADLGISGLVEVEFKFDARDGRVKLLDVNPRVWGWHSIGRAAGIDFAHLAWLLALGEPVASIRGRPGVRWVRLSTDVPTSVREIIARRLGLGAYLRTLRPPLEGPIAARDDLLPALVETPLLLRLAARRFRGGVHV